LAALRLAGMVRISIFGRTTVTPRFSSEMFRILTLFSLYSPS
jgi:hypothetical protein